MMITPYLGQEGKSLPPTVLQNRTEAGRVTECEGSASCLQTPYAMTQQLAWNSPIESFWTRKFCAAVTARPCDGDRE